MTNVMEANTNRKFALAVTKVLVTRIAVAVAVHVAVDQAFKKFAK